MTTRCHYNTVKSQASRARKVFRGNELRQSWSSLARLCMLQRKRIWKNSGACFSWMDFDLEERIGKNWEAAFGESNPTAAFTTVMLRGTSLYRFTRNQWLKKTMFSHSSGTPTATPPLRITKCFCIVFFFFLRIKCTCWLLMIFFKRIES